VDRSRIFTFGLSNGGFMGPRTAGDHADPVAGIVRIARVSDI
jgi:poly(3-hydroxybutyrate) depolymerase